MYHKDTPITRGEFYKPERLMAVVDVNLSSDAGATFEQHKGLIPFVVKLKFFDNKEKLMLIFAQNSSDAIFFAADSYFDIQAAEVVNNLRISILE